MQLTIRQLEILVAAAEAQTFSEAATSLGITQPSLSGTIKRIEHELGVALFDRPKRSCGLTADGRHAAAVAKNAIQEFRAALVDIADRTQGRRGRLTVAALPSIASTIVPPAIEAFRSRVPGVDLRIRDVLHERAVEMLVEGVVDLAVSIQPGPDTRLDFGALGRDQLELVCRADHFLSRTSVAQWDQLGTIPFIALAPTSSVRRLTDAALINCGVLRVPAHEVEQIPSAAGLVRAGLGVTVLPSLTATMYDPSGLIRRPLEPDYSRVFGAITSRDRMVSRPVRTFLDCLRDVFAQRELAG